MVQVRCHRIDVVQATLQQGLQVSFFGVVTIGITKQVVSAKAHPAKLLVARIFGPAIGSTDPADAIWLLIF